MNASGVSCIFDGPFEVAISHEKQTEVEQQAKKLVTKCTQTNLVFIA